MYCYYFIIIFMIADGYDIIIFISLLYYYDDNKAKQKLLQYDISMLKNATASNKVTKHMRRPASRSGNDQLIYEPPSFTISWFSHCRDHMAIRCSVNQLFIASGSPLIPDIWTVINLDVYCPEYRLLGKGRQVEGHIITKIRGNIFSDITREN